MLRATSVLVLQVVAYTHSRDSNHCINIDYSQKTILDTDIRNPNLQIKKRTISILCSYFKINIGCHTSFECIFDSIIDVRSGILVVAYMHNRDSNHCINIDCSLKTILDTDTRNPTPFCFANKQEFISILCSYFKINIGRLISLIQ